MQHQTNRSPTDSQGKKVDVLYVERMRNNSVTVLGVFRSLCRRKPTDSWAAFTKLNIHCWNIKLEHNIIYLFS